MGIVNVLNGFCERLQKSTGVPVMLGPPHGNSNGVFVWPWKLIENAALTRHNTPGEARLEHSVTPGMHILIVAQPSFSEEGLSLLDKVHRSVVDEPVIETDTLHAELVLESLPVEELASLFVSAGLPVTACVCASVLVNGKHN